MQAPPIPYSEPERLRRLYATGLLDSAFEERFDRITRIAQRTFDVPVALISLVDRDRQWFKASEGIEARETPREISFCGHAILDREVFCVEDASADPRFANNPLVIDEPAIRFYAGCPLRSEDGYAYGTLCIIDRAPRSFSDEDRSTLRDLAALAESEIRLSVAELGATADDAGLP